MQAAVPLLQAFVQESDRASRVLRAVYGWTVGQHMEQGNGALCPMPVLTRTHTRTPAHDYEMFVWDNQWLHVWWFSHDRRVWLVAKCESVMSSLGETWQSNWPQLHISAPFVTKGEKQLSIKKLTVQIAYNSRITYFHLLDVTLRITKVHPVD